MALKIGQQIMTWVGLPEQDVVPIRVEIRNFRALGSETLVGARMVELRRVDRKAITHLIIGLRQESPDDE